MSEFYLPDSYYVQPDPDESDANDYPDVECRDCGATASAPYAEGWVYADEDCKAYLCDKCEARRDRR